MYVLPSSGTSENTSSDGERGGESDKDIESVKFKSGEAGGDASSLLSIS